MTTRTRIRAAVLAYHYRIVYRPETLIPDIDLRTSGQKG